MNAGRSGPGDRRGPPLPYGCQQLGTSRQQALKQTDTQTTQRDANAGQQQNGLFGDGACDLTHPTDDGGEYGTDRGHQGCNSNSSLSSILLLSKFCIEQLQHDLDDHTEADQTE